MTTIDGKKPIRMIDSNCNDLFYLKEGESVILTSDNGEKMVRPCKFIAECHTKVGSYTFHICEFAEMMERAGTTYEPERPPELPDQRLNVLPSGGRL